MWPYAMPNSVQFGSYICEKQYSSENGSRISSSPSGFVAGDATALTIQNSGFQMRHVHNDYHSGSRRSLSRIVGGFQRDAVQLYRRPCKPIVACFSRFSFSLSLRSGTMPGKPFSSCGNGGLLLSSSSESSPWHLEVHTTTCPPGGCPERFGGLTKEKT
jgi:hypothetical protein